MQAILVKKSPILHTAFTIYREFSRVNRADTLTFGIDRKSLLHLPCSLLLYGREIPLAQDNTQ